MKRYIFYLLTAAIVFSTVTEVSAIPAFARKYQTSCATCHKVFPLLNPFEVAFKLNGF